MTKMRQINSSLTGSDVSVVIPVFNSEAYLAQTLHSVLAQNCQAGEIIVVNDGSSDSSLKIAQSFGPAVRCLSQSNSGAASARNAGALTATGLILAFLDSDDLWLPDKLELQLAGLNADPDLDMVFGHTEQFLCPLMPTTPNSPALQLEKPLPARLPSAMLIRHAAFLRVGLFNPELKIGDCVDWLARAREIGLKESMLPEVVFRRRIHTDNLGRLQKDQRGDYVRAIKAALDRRRNQGAGVQKNPSEPQPPQ